jgi:hypothetical protein
MSGYTVTLTDSEYDALKARIARLEAALRKCAGELHNYHSIAGDEALEAAHDALCYCDGLPVYRSKEEMPDGGYVYGDTQAEADAKVAQANRGVK